VLPALSERIRIWSTIYRMHDQNAFSQALIERSGYDDDAFAALYDRARPVPPDDLLRILTLLALVERPRLVVDLGAGTGLSTRVWATRADGVIGVEANPQMIERARHMTTVPNVEYVEAYAADTGLADGEADIVTCAQAFHWMDPGPTLAEAARLLRPGGVFAAYDYDVPPVIHPEVDAVFARHFEARRSARKRLRLEAGAETWAKEGHAERLRKSRCFSHVRELVCHGFEQADAERVVELAESLGGPRSIFGGQAPEVDESFNALRAAAVRLIGERTIPIVVCYRVRAGIK
jgi:SAM-dependent methyltransferase